MFGGEEGKLGPYIWLSSTMPSEQALIASPSWTSPGAAWRISEPWRCR